MKSKLAVLSWILPILGAGVKIIFLWFPTPSSIIFLGFAGTGLIFGIVALGKISRSSELTGKFHAIIGVILNIILLLYFYYFTQF